ncbi:hypothetical protein Tco_0773898 [Tanacetum coccineum]|uniref:Transposase (putative) gypsy type domain-containing protein n=1 Tax=Tanacetum coccineum TaxID=301880 RepID=A0ABQ4ZN14_9ASTR
MVESFCNSYYIPDEVYPTAPGRDRTITQFPEGKVGVYTRLFDYCGYRIPLTKFFVSILKYFRIHISQLSRFGAARISHFEVLTRVLDLGPSVAVFRAFYTLVLISVPLYTWGRVGEGSSYPSYCSFKIKAVQFLSSNKAPSGGYPECFLALVGLSPYYPFGENTYTAFEGPDRTDMGLLDYIRTADPRKWLSGAGTEVSVSFAERNVVEESVIPEGAFLNPTDPECDVTVAEKDVAQRQPEKAKRKKLLKRSDPLPAKKSLPEGSLTLRASSPADIRYHVTCEVQSCLPFSLIFILLLYLTLSFLQVPAGTAECRVHLLLDVVTSSRGKTLVLPTSGVGGSSQPETSEESTDSFYETAVLNSEDAGVWEKDAEIARLKSLLEEKETESAEVLRLRDQDTGISLLDSRASYLSPPLMSSAACGEARSLISSLSSERDGLASEGLPCSSFLLSVTFKKRWKIEAGRTLGSVGMCGRLEGEFYPAYLTTLAGRRWLLTHGMELAMVKCLKSPEYQGILGHALGRASWIMVGQYKYNIIN